MVALYHLCVPERIHLQVSHVTPMLVVSTPPVFQSTTARSTTWTARPSPRQHCTPTTTPKNLFSPFLNNFLTKSANAIRSENNAKESLSHLNYERSGNLRINTPTGCEPKEFTTEEVATIPMMRPEEDICQLYDAQRDFGEKDQQAPVIEEMTRIGQTQVQSSLDQEMAEMSPMKKMSYLQSRMHFDKPVESNADSDLEDGEIRNLLTSSLYDRKASGRPDAKEIQESEVNAQTSHSSGREDTRGPVALFALRRNGERDQMWSSVFSGTLLAGSKDHLSGKIRSSQRRNSCGVSQ